ncbi:lipopolysaccharide biosynthesis protein [Alcanivorax sp. DP30]|uniref:lipopolysaccharide biosynthesis protein n=1 Tax=Alcanivorax sp. DP30 TaxID=2606217 RepID=UPI00136F5DCA|nr:oligosaccharide flippase family protein [Alcanivorax sp. DP30]
MGVFWTFLEVLLSRGAQTFFTLFLASILAPEAFGLIAIVAVVFELSNAMVNAGFTQALIRAKTISDEELSTAFWSNLGISLIIYLLIISISGGIADFYDEAVIGPMVIIMGLAVIVNAFRIVQTAILSRDMNFKSQMLAATTGTMVSGVIAVVMAYNGAGVWSLVAQMLISQVVNTVFLWCSTHWLPRFQFNYQAFIQLFDFGKYLVVANIFNILFKNSYALVIAKLFSPEVTGLYYMANKITKILSQQMTGVIQRVSFPMLSKLQDNDEVLKERYRQIMQLSVFAMSFVMLGLGVFAKPLFEVLLDEKWAQSVVFLQLLCLTGLFYPAHALNVNLLMVKGRTDLNLRLNLIKKVIQLAVLIGSVSYGVLGIVVGQVLASVLSLVPNTLYTSRLIGYTFWLQFLDLIKPVLSALLGAAVFWGFMKVDISPILLKQMLAGVLACACYLASSFVLRAEGALMMLKQLKALHARLK